MKHRLKAHAAYDQESWRTMLRAKPVRNKAAAARRHSEIELRITIPRRRPAFLVAPLSWIVRPRLSRTIVLDMIGIEIWEQCDGQRNVEEVVDAVARTHRLSFHEARVAVTNYIRLLVERGALAMVMSE